MSHSVSQEMWLRFHEAVAVVRQHRPGSIGRTEALVLQAGASGEVRSLERGVEDFSQRYGSKAKTISVLSKDDLIDWLNRNVPPTVPAKPAAPSARAATRNKRDRAEQAVRALWPAGVPAPAALPPAVLCKQVSDWLKADCKAHHLPAVDISDDTILRAAGRK
jgi:hypothetical protein